MLPPTAPPTVASHALSVARRCGRRGAEPRGRGRGAQVEEEQDGSAPWAGPGAGPDLWAASEPARSPPRPDTAASPLLLTGAPRPPGTGEASDAARSPATAGGGRGGAGGEGTRAVWFDDDGAAPPTAAPSGPPGTAESRGARAAAAAAAAAEDLFRGENVSLAEKREVCPRCPRPHPRPRPRPRPRRARATGSTGPRYASLSRRTTERGRCRCARGRRS